MLWKMNYADSQLSQILRQLQPMGKHIKWNIIIWIWLFLSDIV